MTPPSGRSASLGRGLSALIPQAASTTPVPAEIPIDRIERSPYQPRTVFELDQLAQLRASIQAHGILQPVLVTETLEGAVEAALRSAAPVRRDTPKVGRNDPCPCVSGKKYKKCHGVTA